MYFCGKLRNMRVYFYHTQNIQYILDKYKKGEFPAHFLYGATKLQNYGIDVIWHKNYVITNRFVLMLYNTFRILFCRKHFDALYATHYRGLEIIIFLRALGLFRRPVVIWHHQPIVSSKSLMREWLGRLFYHGIDDMFFFSQKLINDSLKTKRTNPEKMHLGHWGADLKMYDRVLAEGAERNGFVSSGKEMRDMPTLVKAFNRTSARLDIYLNESNGGINYMELFDAMRVGNNISVNFQKGLIPYELARVVNRSSCVVICCQETKYTVGLTTVVEALALGLPIICSRNPQIPVDIDKEGCGISVPYYDVGGWVKAIEFIKNHPDEAVEMGKRGRKLAEEVYNDDKCAAEVAKVLLCYRII